MNSAADVEFTQSTISSTLDFRVPSFPRMRESRFFQWISDYAGMTATPGLSPDTAVGAIPRQTPAGLKTSCRFRGRRRTGTNFEMRSQRKTTFRNAEPADRPPCLQQKSQKIRFNPKTCPGNPGILVRRTLTLELKRFTHHTSPVENKSTDSVASRDQSANFHSGD